MPKKVQITGIGGFAGRYMEKYVRSLSQSHEIMGLDICQSDTDCNLYKKVDLSSAPEVAEIVSHNKPDYIMHFAGLFCSDDVQHVYSSNVLSLTALLEAVTIRASEIVKDMFA